MFVRRQAMAVLVAVCIATSGPSAYRPAVADIRASGFAFTRVDGVNRFGTASALARQAFPGGAGTAILASGSNFPDALAANYLAGQDGAPILLVGPSAPVPAETLTAIGAL